MAKPMTIGQIAERVGIGVETVRFYERRGLVAEPPRSAAGYREYPEAIISRLRFIRRAKQLGFTLKEIQELLSLRTDPATACCEVRDRAEAKIADIETRIRALREMKRALVKLTATCSAGGNSCPCPILEALDSEGPG